MRGTLRRRRVVSCWFCAKIVLSVFAILLATMVYLSAQESREDPLAQTEEPSPIKMFVVFSRYGADSATNASVVVAGWKATITLVDGTHPTGPLQYAIITKGKAWEQLPRKIEFTKKNNPRLIVDFVYSDEQGAWGKFLNAWRQDYQIVAYSGHANQGQYFDIGPKVVKEHSGEHQGEPKNGYVVLRQQVPQTPVALYVALCCYPEIPYGLLDSTCVRIMKTYPNVNAIGHRKSAAWAKANIEVADIIKMVLKGKMVEGVRLTGLDVLPKLTAEDVHIADKVTAKDRDGRRNIFKNNGATAIWHNIGDRRGYNSAWEPGWEPYTEAELIAGATGRPKEQKVLDDVQRKPLHSEHLSSTTAVVSRGPNTFLETCVMGDDKYKFDSHREPIAIVAGPNDTCDTSTTGVDQFWAKFQLATEGSSLKFYDLVSLWAALHWDAVVKTTTFQEAVRNARE